MASRDDATAEATAELLDQIRHLRLLLTTDLAAMAGAIEADELAVARDIVSADQQELHSLSTQLQPTAATTPAAAPRRRRALLALPAIPLVGALAMTGAAAIGGSGHHAMGPARHVGPTANATVGRVIPRPRITSASATLRQLEQVIRHDPTQAAVVSVARHLHEQLTSMIDSSADSPQQLGEVKHLLAIEQRLLEDQTGRGAAIALAASRQIDRLLNRTGVTAAVRSTAPTVPAQPGLPTPTTTTLPTTAATTAATPQSSTPTSPSSSTANRHHHHHHRRSLPNPLLGAGLLSGQL